MVNPTICIIKIYWTKSIFPLKDNFNSDENNNKHSLAPCEGIVKFHHALLVYADITSHFSIVFTGYFLACYLHFDSLVLQDMQDPPPTFLSFSILTESACSEIHIIFTYSNIFFRCEFFYFKNIYFYLKKMFA